MVKPHRVIPLFSEEEIKRRVKELGREITEDMKDIKPHVVGILKGAWMFMADLVREIELDITCDFITISSYGDQMTSSGEVQIVTDLSIPIKGKDILLVEDIVDSGVTIYHLINMLKEKQPNSIRLCAFLDKKEARKVDVNIDYVGFECPNKFVVGYGLDYAQHYRNLKYIGYIEFDKS